MNTRSLSGRAFALVSVCAFLPATSATLDAATFTWNASSNVGGTTYQWSSGSNWQGGGSPVSDSGTRLEFTAPGSGGTYTLSNDLSPTPFELNSIRFAAASSANIATISGSQLRFVNDGAAGPSIFQDGSLQFNLNTAIALDATLTLQGSGAGQVSIGGLISGTGSIVIDPSSNAGFVLTHGGSTFSGGVTLNAGRLVVQSNSTLSGGSLVSGPLGTGTLTLNGGSIRGASGDRTLHNDLVLGGNVTFGDGTGNSRSLNFAGPATIAGTAATRTLTLSGSSSTATAVTFSGAISDGGNGNGLTFAGSGVAALGGGAADIAANTYTGTTTVNAAGATLNLDKAAGTAAVAGDLVLNSGRIAFKRANQIADTSTVTVNGSTFNFADSATALDAGVNETIAGLVVTSGTMNIDPSGGAANTVTVTGTAAFTGGVSRVNAGSTLSAERVILASATGNTLRVGGTLAVGGGGFTLTQTDTGGSGGFLDSLRLAAERGDGTNNLGGTLQLDGDFTVIASDVNTNGLRITTSGSPLATIDVHGGDRVFNIGDGAAAVDLTVNARFADSLGGGGFTKTGAGTMVLNANANNFAGTVTVDQGVLRYGSAAVLEGPVTVDGATAVLDLNNFSDTMGTVTLDGGGLITTGTSGSLTSTGTFEMKSGTVDIVLSGAGAALNKTTGGTLVLKRANNYEGGTTLSAGVTSIVFQGAFGSGAINFNGGALRIDSSADIGKNISNAVNIGGDITLGDESGPYRLTMLGATTLVGGTHTITTQGADTVWSGAIGDGGNGYGIVKAGSAALILDGANTYTGLSTVNEGTLTVGSSNGGASLAGGVLVNSGALSGIGRIVGTVSIGNASGSADAAIAPGAGGIGTLTLESSFTMLSDATYRFELNSDLGTADRIVADGVTLDGTFSFSDLGNTALAADTTFIVIENSSLGAISGAFAGLDEGAVFSWGANHYSITYLGGNGNDVALTVIPEPGVWGLMAAGLAGSFAARRFMRRRVRG